MAFTKNNIKKELIGIKKVVALLEKYGAKVGQNIIPEAFSLRDFDTKTIKELSAFIGSKFDLIVTRMENGECYLCEVKTKSKEKYLGIVNKKDYDAYVRIAVKLRFPFLYMVYCKETDKVYRHKVVDPQEHNFKTDIAPDGKLVYYIPHALFHEVTPSWIKRIDAWFKWSRYQKSQTRKDDIDKTIPIIDVKEKGSNGHS